MALNRFSFDDFDKWDKADRERMRVRILPHPEPKPFFVVQWLWAISMRERGQFTYVRFKTLKDQFLKAEEHIHKWCRANCTHPYYVGHFHIRFDAEHDAAAFYLTFKRK